MARRPRIHVDGYPLHIVQRGHNRERCFFREMDYRFYKDWLAEALVDAQCALHAYVLMTNHVHLLLTPARAALVPKLLIALGRRYVQYINTAHERRGTLWEGRYKSSLVDQDIYLLACMRYIELNPVRAGIVSSAASYPWTSYRVNACGALDRLVTPHPSYRQLGQDERSRQAAYRDLFRVDVAVPMLSEIRNSIRSGAPLGPPPFAQAVERTLGRPCLPRRPGRPRRDSSPVGERNA